MSTLPRSAAPDARTAGVRSAGVRTPALVVVAVAVLMALVGVLVQPAHHVGPDATALVALACRVVAVVAAAGVLGSLLLCLCQPPGTGPDRGLLASASAWASAWAGALGVGFAIEVVDPASVSARVAAGPDSDVDTRLRLLVLGFVLAALVRVLSPAVRSRADVGAVCAVAVCGLLVAAGTGHGVSSSSATASLALLAHVLAASAWTGGLLALVVHGRSLEPPWAGAPTARAYSRVALVCYVVLASSGVLGVLSRTDLGSLLDGSGYLVLVLVKTGLLVVLGLCGAAQRRSGLARLEAGDRGAFLLLAVGELVLMAAALGLGVALAHTTA